MLAKPAIANKNQGSKTGLTTANVPHKASKQVFISAFL
jgi:hypothetical protein